MRVVDLNLPTCPHVYPVREDSLLLATGATVLSGERVLEVGCGLGLASLSAARAGGRVVSCDLNPHALRALRTQASARGTSIDAVRTDLFAGLGRFDVVLCNPPYLPTVEAERDPDPWQDLALNGGEDGRAFVRRFVREIPDHLAPRGRAYLLTAETPGLRGEERAVSPAPPSPGAHLEVERRVPGEVLRLWRIGPAPPA